MQKEILCTDIIPFKSRVLKESKRYIRKILENCDRKEIFAKLLKNGFVVQRIE
jgi:hypothetical protein